MHYGFYTEMYKSLFGMTCLTEPMVREVIHWEKKILLVNTKLVDIKLFLKILSMKGLDKLIIQNELNVLGMDGHLSKVISFVS